MIDFVLQEPFMPEGVTLQISISVYEATWAVPHIENVASMLFAAEKRIQKAEADANR